MQYTLTDEQIDKFNSLYNKACSLYNGLLILDREEKPKLGFFDKRKLIKSIATFEAALKIHPASWQSMVFIAKAHQSLGNMESALSWLQQAHEHEPLNASIAKELGLCAGTLGNHPLAIRYMANVAELNPNDFILHVNLGVSYLLSGQLNQAKAAFSQAAISEPSNPTNGKLVSLVENVILGKVPCPKSQSEIAKFI